MLPIGTVLPHNLRVVSYGAFVGGVCACDHWHGDWRRSRGWVARDWRGHLAAVVHASPGFEADQRARERGEGPMVLV